MFLRLSYFKKIGDTGRADGRDATLNMRPVGKAT